MFNSRFLYISVSTFLKMEFMDFYAISFGSDFDMGLLCTKLNNVVGTGIWFGTFTVQNTK